MSFLSLVRHGQSDWNEKNLFTGWQNPGLTQKGLEEAKVAGKILSTLNIEYDYFYTSVLDRAILTGEIIIEEDTKLTDSKINDCLNNGIKSIDLLTDDEGFDARPNCWTY